MFGEGYQDAEDSAKKEPEQRAAGLGVKSIRFSCVLAGIIDPSPLSPAACIAFSSLLWDFAASLIPDLGTTAKGFSLVLIWDEHPAHFPGRL